MSAKIALRMLPYLGRNTAVLASRSIHLKPGIGQLAPILLGAFRRHGKLRELPPILVPKTLEEAYEVQSGLISGKEKNWLAGWKVGATSPQTQQRLGVDGPFRGPIPSSCVHTSPAKINPKHLGARGIESEIAFTLKEAIPASNKKSYTPEDISAAIDTMSAAIEVIGTRHSSTNLPIMALVADFGGHGALVLGDAVKWDPKMARGMENWYVRVDVDGAVKAEGTPGDVMGHPLHSLTWLVNHFAARGYEMPAGTVISTGTCTGVLPIPHHPSLITARFENLGSVQVQITLD